MQPFFFSLVQQPRRSARRSPGSARGFGRVAQVRAEVRVTHTQAILTPDLADQFIIRAI